MAELGIVGISVLVLIVLVFVFWLIKAKYGRIIGKKKRHQKDRKIMDIDKAEKEKDENYHAKELKGYPLKDL